MRHLLAASLLALASSGVAAQDTYTADGQIVYDTSPILSPDEYNIPLDPGEEIIGFYASPSIVRIPLEQDIVAPVPFAEAIPPVEIDRVTGLPRNTPGWTGDDTEPLGIGCFPQGVCADFNE